MTTFATTPAKEPIRLTIEPIRLTISQTELAEMILERLDKRLGVTLGEPVTRVTKVEAAVRPQGSDLVPTDVFIFTLNE